MPLDYPRNMNKSGGLSVFWVNCFMNKNIKILFWIDILVSIQHVEYIVHYKSQSVYTRENMGGLTGAYDKLWLEILLRTYSQIIKLLKCVMVSKVVKHRKIVQYIIWCIKNIKMPLVLIKNWKNIKYLTTITIIRSRVFLYGWKYFLYFCVDIWFLSLILF